MEELFEKAKDGDENAFEKIVNRLKQELYVIAMSRLMNETLAEEAIQDTIISLYENIYKIRDSSKVKNWCVIVLINKCKKIRKSQKIREISYEEIECEKFLYSDDEFKKIIDKLSFFQLIEELNDKDKLIITLYYSSNLTTKEISSILNINESTIRSKISRIKKEIKGRLGDKFNGKR